MYKGPVQGSRIKPGTDFWFYVRSVNLVGKSAFVEVSGQPSNDGEGYLEFFREKIGKLHLAQGLWELIDNSQLADEMAEMKTTITETRNEITQTVSKTLENQSATIQQIQRSQVIICVLLHALYLLYSGALVLQRFTDRLCDFIAGFRDGGLHLRHLIRKLAVVYQLP
ncbi:phage tail protein [Escherichia coli]|nr:phage tail protein [Escherichia coli]